MQLILNWFNFLTGPCCTAAAPKLEPAYWRLSDLFLLSSSLLTWIRSAPNHSWTPQQLLNSIHRTKSSKLSPNFNQTSPSIQSTKKLSQWGPVDASFSNLCLDGSQPPLWLGLVVNVNDPTCLETPQPLFLFVAKYNGCNQKIATD